MPKKDYRIRLGHSAEGVALNFEQGGGANPATLKKLADVLGVRPVDLLKVRR